MIIFSFFSSILKILTKKRVFCQIKSYNYPTFNSSATIFNLISRYLFLFVKNLYLKIFFNICFICFASNLSAQYKKNIIIVKGKLMDSATKLPIKDATISAFRFQDTALLNFSFSSTNGNFYMEVTSTDSIFITFSSFEYYEKNVTFQSSENSWYFSSNNVELAKDNRWQTLGTVTIRSSPINMRGDTIEILASRFKVLPGSDVAQLFKKIPGMEVDVKGEVKVNGKVVNKILVDGSAFFGNNPGLVSKTINADMVDKVQVFNEKDAFGNLVPNGETIINLTLKKGKSNGLFGDALLGGGNKQRFESGLRLNSFKNDRKISVIVNGNNINDAGFDFGFESWNAWVSQRRLGQVYDNKVWENAIYTISERGNINNKNGLGFNYFNEIKNNRKLSSTINYTSNFYKNIDESITENQISDSSTRKSVNQSNASGNSNLYEYEINYVDRHDTMYNLEIVWSGNKKDLLFRENTESVISINDVAINSSSNIGLSNQSNQKHNLSVEMYNRLSKKRGKASINSKAILGFSDLNNSIYRYNDGRNNTFNIKNNMNNKDYFLQINSGLNIPLSEKWSASINAEFANQVNNFDIFSFNAAQLYKTFDQDYSVRVDSLSGNIKNMIANTAGSGAINYRLKNGGASIALNGLNTQIYSTGILQSNKIDINRQFFSLLPEANFYKYKSTEYYLSLSASQSASLPSGSDLVPIYNVFNVWQQAVGNVNLGQTITNNLNLYFYKTFKSKSPLKTMYFNYQYTESDNYKANNTFTTLDGVQQISPTLLSGYRYFSASNSLSVKTFKNSALYVSASNTYQQLPSIANEIIVRNTFTTNNYRVFLNLNKTDSFFSSVSLSINQSSNRNDNFSRLNFTQIVPSIETNIRFINRFGTEFNADFEIQDNRAIPGIGKIIPLLHCFIQQPLDKKHTFNIKLTAYDIFKQNVGISRVVNNGFVNTTMSNRLQQFFMFTLVYKVKKMGGDVQELVY